MNQIRLPVEPLIAAYDMRIKVLMPEKGEPCGLSVDIRKRLSKARSRGFASIDLIDTICCDFLNINPTEIYGWEFLTVGTEEEVA